MKIKWFGSQIVLNKVEHSLLTGNDFLKRKLALAKEALALDTLLIWPDRDKKNLELTKKICSDFQIKTYLWYPLLADIALFKIRPEEAVETFEGQRGYGKHGRWPQLGQGEEDFLFLCPNNEQALDKIFQHFENQLKTDDYDGVFLDRIRFPSPGNGLESLYTCFCPWCQRKFSDYYQEDLNRYRPLVKDFFQQLRAVELSDLAYYRSLSDILRPDHLQRFFDFRAQSIFQLTRRFAEEAKKRNKTVGLDLFAPSLSSLVAQDYRELATISDWLKPMVYCHTASPAGLPLEYGCLLQGLLALNPGLNEKQLISEASRIVKAELPCSLSALLKEGVPEDIIIQEAERLKDFSLTENENRKIYIGLEAVQAGELAHIDGPVLKKYLSAVSETDLDGILLSWNLLKIPDQNLRVVGDLL